MRSVMAIIAVVVCSTGCDNALDDCRNTRTCPPPPDAGTTVIYVAGDGVVPCEGACARGNNFDWQDPWMVYLGPDQSKPPLCPEQAPNTKDYRAAPALEPCPACECDVPIGSCALPATVNANNAACPATNPGTVQTPFDPPSGWDGACTAQQAITANLDCNGSPCVQSATFAPLSLNELGCTPKLPVVPYDNPKSLTFARTCGGTAKGECSSASDVCIPALPSLISNGPGLWTYCVTKHGANDDYTMTCPPEYPSKYVFSLDYDDSRACAPCTCGPPEGSECSSLVSVYADNECSATKQVGSITVSAAPMCLNLPPGSPIGSVNATTPVYKPGSCQPSGGELTGNVHEIGPMTFCCQK